MGQSCSVQHGDRAPVDLKIRCLDVALDVRCGREQKDCKETVIIPAPFRHVPVLKPVQRSPSKAFTKDSISTYASEGSMPFSDCCASVSSLAPTRSPLSGRSAVTSKSRSASPPRSLVESPVPSGSSTPIPGGSRLNIDALRSLMWGKTENEEQRRIATGCKLQDGFSNSAPGFLGLAERKNFVKSSHESQKDDEDVCFEGDCLPLDGLVWVQGDRMPRCVSSLSQGDNVLCHDSIFGGLSYSSIVNLQVKETGHVHWVKVGLKDGTSLQVTADHPMRPVDQQRVVHASKLKPNHHKIMVMKLVPVAVESVTPCVRAAARGSVEVHQPARFTPLVRDPGNPHLMAVGSTDHYIPDVSTKRTFVDIGNDSHRIQRSNSAPDVLCGREPLAASDDDSSKQDSAEMMSRTFSADVADPAALVVHDAATAPALEAETDIDSERTRGDDADADVVVGPGPTPDQVTLTEILKLQMAGLQSIGSVTHSRKNDHNCRICLFQNRHHHEDGPSCFKGYFCEFCHEDHAKIPKPKRRYGRTRVIPRRPLLLNLPNELNAGRSGLDSGPLNAPASPRGR